MSDAKPSGRPPNLYFAAARGWLRSALRLFRKGESVKSWCAKIAGCLAFIASLCGWKLTVLSGWPLGPTASLAVAIALAILYVFVAFVDSLNREHERLREELGIQKDAEFAARVRDLEALPPTPEGRIQALRVWCDSYCDLLAGVDRGIPTATIDETLGVLEEVLRLVLLEPDYHREFEGFRTACQQVRLIAAVNARDGIDGSQFSKPIAEKAKRWVYEFRARVTTGMMRQNIPPIAARPLQLG